MPATLSHTFPGRISVWLVLVVGSALLLLAVGVLLYTSNRHGPLPQLEIPTRSFPATAVPPLLEQRNLTIPSETAREINAARPYDDRHVEPARPFKGPADVVAQERAIGCLAAAAWYEAGDDAEGERSVIQTVLNRVRHPAFPSTICGVVFQGQERQTGCQFTFTCDGALQRMPSDAAWQRAVSISRAMLSGEVYAPIGYSTHYHTDWVVPYWGPSLAKVAKVRTHIFYRWPGFWGTRAAFKQVVQSAEPIIPALAHLSEAHLPSAVPSLTSLDTARLVPEASVIVEKPVLQLPGVSQRSMHGSTVRLAPRPDTFFLKLEDRAFAGNYAISALAVCKNKTNCQVYGWTDSASIADQLPLTEAQRAKLLFYYVRGADGEDRALWNCDQIPRKNHDQCMPAGPLPTLK